MESSGGGHLLQGSPQKVSPVRKTQPAQQAPHQVCCEPLLFKYSPRIEHAEDKGMFLLLFTMVKPFCSVLERETKRRHTLLGAPYFENNNQTGTCETHICEKNALGPMTMNFRRCYEETPWFWKKAFVDLGSSCTRFSSELGAGIAGEPSGCTGLSGKASLFRYPGRKHQYIDPLELCA